VLALLFAGGPPRLVTVCLVLVLCSAFATLQTLAFTASTRLLVPDRHLERANGMAQLGASAAHIVAPLAAGFLTETIGVHGVILIDVATLAVALGILAFVRIPSPRPAEPRPAGWRALAADARQGLSYVTERPGLLGLLLLFAAVNLSFGMVQTLLSPLVLSFASASDLGKVLSVTGFGMMAGGLLVVWRGVPRGRTVRTILALTALEGSLLLLGGARPSLGLVAGAAAVYVFCIPIVASSSLALWQRKVPPYLHGRVFALTRMVSMSAFPVAYLAAGPLADRVFEPLLAPGGGLADSVGAVIGVGPGRGIGLMFVLLGVLTLAAIGVAGSYRPLRRLEADLPDVAVDGAPAATPVTATEGASRMVP
ncbi:MAG TPA: MFS transporter, partial [Thermoanaerobaculia bacterium]|nr:MFS transporter [Thermoanaerobaculia bacterium]